MAERMHGAVQLWPLPRWRWWAVLVLVGSAVGYVVATIEMAREKCMAHYALEECVGLTTPKQGGTGGD